MATRRKQRRRSNPNRITISNTHWERVADALTGALANAIFQETSKGNPLRDLQDTGRLAERMRLSLLRQWRLVPRKAR